MFLQIQSVCSADNLPDQTKNILTCKKERYAVSGIIVMQIVEKRVHYQVSFEKQDKIGENQKKTRTRTKLEKLVA